MCDNSGLPKAKALLVEAPYKDTTTLLSVQGHIGLTADTEYNHE